MAHTHKFDPAHMEKLDRPERYKILPPEEILVKTGLSEGEILADIGAGNGFFSIPASKITGATGGIIAVDTSREMLDEIEKRAAEKNITNITTVLSDEYHFKIPDNSADRALLSMIIHEVEDKKRFLSETGRIIKPGGMIIIIDWLKKETPMGPPVAERVDGDEVKSLLIDLNFKAVASGEISDTFYMITGYRK